MILAPKKLRKTVECPSTLPVISLSFHSNGCGRDDGLSGAPRPSKIICLINFSRGIPANKVRIGGKSNACDVVLRIDGGVTHERRRR
jgi:hypothetical protein